MFTKLIHMALVNNLNYKIACFFTAYVEKWKCQQCIFSWIFTNKFYESLVLKCRFLRLQSLLYTAANLVLIDLACLMQMVFGTGVPVSCIFNKNYGKGMYPKKLPKQALGSLNRETHFQILI